MAHPEVLTALSKKISRERIGVEVVKMLEGPRPYSALQLLHDYGALDVVFAPPEGQQMPPTMSSDEEYPRLAIEYVHVMHRFWDAAALPAGLNRKVAYLCAAIAPLRGTSYCDARGRELPTPSFVIRASLKLSALEGSDTQTVLDGALLFEQAWSRLEDRVTFGLLIRRLGALWEHSLMIACCALVVEHGRSLRGRRRDNLLLRFG